MIFNWVFIAITLAQGALGQNQTVINAFQTVNLAPDVFTTAPPEALTVKYNGAAVNLGNRITRRTANVEPSVSFPPARNDQLHTLIALDADGFDSLGSVGQLLCQNKNLPTILWRVNNIFGDKVTDAAAIVDYQGPSQSDHRIAFYYFLQSSGINTGGQTTANLNRACFDLKEYASLNSLTLIAGNFFLSA